jgi:hypothetical protein
MEGDAFVRTKMATIRHGTASIVMAPFRLGLQVQHTGSCSNRARMALSFNYVSLVHVMSRTTMFQGKSPCSQVRATVDRNPVVFAIPTTRARLSETHRNTGEPAPAADSLIEDSSMHGALLVRTVSRAEGARRRRRRLERRSTDCFSVSGRATSFRTLAAVLSRPGATRNPTTVFDKVACQVHLC